MARKVIENPLEEQLQRELADMNEHQADELIDLPGETSDVDRAVGMFPVMLAMLILGRMVIYVFLEKMGAQLPLLGMICNALFGIAAVLIIYKWVGVGWAIIEWLMIPKLEVVLVALLTAAHIFTGGRIWHEAVLAPAANPYAATVLVLVAVLLTATTGLERGIMNLIDFLNHPISTVRRYFS